MRTVQAPRNRFCKHIPFPEVTRETEYYQRTKRDISSLESDKLWKEWETDEGGMKEYRAGRGAIGTLQGSSDMKLNASRAVHENFVKWNIFHYPTSYTRHCIMLRILISKPTMVVYLPAPNCVCTKSTENSGSHLWIFTVALHEKSITRDNSVYCTCCCSIVLL